MKHEQLLNELKEFLKDYNENLDDVEYSDENGYPRSDALFDAILFHDFCEHLRKTNKFDLWVKFNNDMDKDIRSKAYLDSTEIWNQVCDLVVKKVEECY